MHVRLGHGGHQGGGVFGRHQHRLDRADDAHVAPVAVTDHDAVQAVLRVQLIPHPGRAQGGAQHAPAQVARRQGVI